MFTIEAMAKAFNASTDDVQAALHRGGWALADCTYDGTPLYSRQAAEYVAERVTAAPVAKAAGELRTAAATEKTAWVAKMKGVIVDE